MQIERHRYRAIILTSVLLSLNYFYWRITSTLNPEAMAFSIFLLWAELHGFIEALLYFFMVWKPKSNICTRPIENATVDVLVATLNEDLDLLRIYLNILLIDLHLYIVYVLLILHILSS